VHFPAVYSRRLHTRESGEFKRQNGMPAMKNPGLLPQGYGRQWAMHCSQNAALAGGTVDGYL
jgi:hypothetical protein